MDSQDNRQHRIRHQQVVPSYSGAVAPIYSGVDTTRGPTPAAHRARRPARGSLPMDYGDKLSPSPQYIFTPPRRYIFTPPLTNNTTESGRRR